MTALPLVLQADVSGTPQDLQATAAGELTTHDADALTQLTAAVTQLTAIVAALAGPLLVGGSVEIANDSGNSIPVTETGLSQVVDANNTTTLTQGSTVPFVGPWTATRSARYVRQLTVVASNVVAGLGGTFTFEYSEDGATATISEARTIGDFATLRDFDLENAGAYYRVKFTPSRALTAGEFIYITTTHSRIYVGQFVRLAGQQIEEANAAMPDTFAYLKAFDPTTGKSTNIRPTTAGDLRVGYEATPLTGLSTTATVIGVGATFTSSWVDVKNYASLTIAPNVDQLIQGYLDWSIDGAALLFDNTTPFVGAGSFSVPVQARYARIRATNLAASTAHFTVAVYGTYQAPGTFLFPVAAPIDDSFPASLVKASITVQQPDGAWVNERASGLAVDVDGNEALRTTTIAANGVWQTGWIPTRGWDSIGVDIATTVVSATDGILLEFTEDLDTPVARLPLTRTFDAAAAATGSAVFRLAPRLTGCRLTYTNGGTATPAFFGAVHLHADPVELPQGPVTATVNGTSTAVMTRGAVIAPNASDQWANIGRGTNGGLNVGVVEHTTETPIKSLSSFKVTRVSVTTTPAAVFTPQANCRSWVAKAITSAGKVVYIGESDADATPGAGFPLQNQEWVGGDLSAGVVHASSDAGTQALAFFETLL